MSRETIREIEHSMSLLRDHVELKIEENNGDLLKTENDCVMDGTKYKLDGLRMQWITQRRIEKNRIKRERRAERAR